MNWEEHTSLPGGFTLWTSRQPRYWAVTRDRDGRGVVPRHDLNHPITKKAALEMWAANQQIPEGAVLDNEFTDAESEAVELDRR